MSYIQRELDKIETAIRNTEDGPTLDCLRVAQQSLHWALDPDCVSSPSKYLNKFHGTDLAPTAGMGIVFEELPAAPAQQSN